MSMLQLYELGIRMNYKRLEAPIVDKYGSGVSTQTTQSKTTIKHTLHAESLTQSHKR